MRGWLRRWGSWAFALPAFALTLALVGAAIWGSVGREEGPRELPWWLRPSATGTAVMCVGLWLAALFAFWWPRRNQRRSWELLGIGGAATLAIVFGLAAAAPCNGGSDDALLTPIWHTMVLFVGTSPAPFDDGGNCFVAPDGGVPLAAQASRFSAMAAVFGAAIALALKFGEQQWSRLRAMTEYVPQVVIGIDDVGLPLVRSLVDWRAKGSDVAVLALEGQEARAAEARELGARSFVIRSRSSGRVTPTPKVGDERSVEGQALLRQRDLDQLVDSIRPYVTTRGRRLWPFGRRRLDVSAVWIMDGDLDRALLIREALSDITDRYPARKPKRRRRDSTSKGPSNRRQRQGREQGDTGDSAATDGAVRDVRVVVRCDDRLVAQRLRAQWIKRRDLASTGTRVLYDALSYNQVTAAELVGRVARDMAAIGDDYTLVVCGDTALTEAIGAELLVRSWEEADLAAAWQEHQSRCPDQNCGHRQEGKPTPPRDGDPEDILVGGIMPTRVVFVDFLAGVVARNLVQGGLPIGVDPPEIGFVATPWQGLLGEEKPMLLDASGEPPRESDEPLAQPVREPNGSPHGIAVILTEEVPASRHHVAARINAMFGPDRCVVWHQPQAGEPQDADTLEPPEGQTRTLRLETYRNDILMYGLWPEDSWIRAARHTHEAYRRVYFDESGPQRNLWWHSEPERKLSNDTRLDNIRQVHQALTGSLGVGAVWAVREPGESAWKTGHELVESLGKAEHERWCRDRRALGWTFGDKKDADDLTHPQLVPWDDLPDEERKRSILAGRRILQHISASGFRLVGCDSSGVCQHCGQPPCDPAQQ